MKTLHQHLAQYADYHRDRRNVISHFVGIPMIVLGVATLAARPQFELGPLTVSPATALTLGALGFYLRLDRRFALAMAAWFLPNLALAHYFGSGTTSAWLYAGLSLFVVGWAIQAVGHVFEGRKPAFVDDLVGLLVGPLFLMAEVAFVLNWRPEVRDAVHVPALAGGQPSESKL